MKFSTQPIISFLKEIAIVVLGVLIAVFINNFKENISNKKYIQKTLSAIEKEVRQSTTDVDKIMQKHLIIADSIQQAADNDQESLAELIGRLGGIQVPNTKNVGLRFFISNKAELVDYEIISQLLDIEATTNILEKKTENLLNFGYDVLEKKDEDTKMKFVLYLANVIESEQTLLELYEIFLDENKTYLQQSVEQ